MVPTQMRTHVRRVAAAPGRERVIGARRARPAPARIRRLVGALVGADEQIDVLADEVPQEPLLRLIFHPFSAAARVEIRPAD